MQFSHRQQPAAVAVLNMETNDLLNHSNFASFCDKLRSDHLLISHEQIILSGLNTKINTEFRKLCQKVWICRHEQEVLHQLINSGPTVSPENCYKIIHDLNSSTFIEAHKVLNYQANELVEIYKMLATAPRAVSIFLNCAEKINTQYSIDELCSSIFNVVYGSCCFPEDEKNILELLGHLVIIQLVQSPDPRKMLRKGCSTFPKLYKYFSEALLTTKIFLTAALHDPIMFLLSQDELFLDIDPAKSPIRIHPSEKYRHFGTDQNSKLYQEKMQQHRKAIVAKLVLITEKFITSILNAMPIFPRNITWLVGQMHTALIEKKLISKQEAALICTDLIFTYFICSAVINPEHLGIISDTPISHIARFNLMQIAQILQTLAIMPYEQRFPAYFAEILSQLDKESMTTVISTILQSETASIETISPIQVPDPKGNEIFRRKTFVGTLREVNVLQAYLKSTAVDEISDAALRKSLKNIMRKMPEQFNANAIHNGSVHSPEKTPAIQTSSSMKLKNLADKVQNVASRSHQRLMQTSSVSNLRNFHQRHLTNSSSVNTFSPDQTIANQMERNIPHELNGNSEKQEQSDANTKRQVVLIFDIPDAEEPIGLSSEEEIIGMMCRIESKRRKFANGQKKTRFLTATESIVSDRTATDVVSDDEEEEEDEIDEARAESSVSSSNENAEETEENTTLPDNFSDVVPISANVSGRGSPSLSGGRLSGRDTPFSGNVPEQNNDPSILCSTIPAIATQPPEPRRTLPSIPVTVRKQNTEGLEEKFGKFGLPPQDTSRNRDETVSLVSDSWSTDVVASDNEGLAELRIAAEQSSGVHAHSPANVPQQQQPHLNINANPNRIHPSAVTNNKQIVLPSSSTGQVVSAAALQQPTVQQENSAATTSSAPIAATNESIVEEDRPYYDPNNLTKCRAFLDVKRKLQLVLSCTYSTATILTAKQQQSGNQKLNGDIALLKKAAEMEANNLHQILKLLLAESTNSRDFKMIAQIREVQRCLSFFDTDGIAVLLRSMKKDQRKRMAYILYMQKSRLTLLQLDYCLEKMEKRIHRDTSLTSECFVEMLVRIYLQKKEQFLKQFVYDFQRLRVQDEKIDLVESHLRHLCEQLLVEPSWRHATLENIEYSRKCLERTLMAHIYLFALFPNADADYFRDEVLSKSIQQLSLTIAVEHPELGISKSLHAESPWPSAQAELSIINAYKSPRDKMACITRCCETIENLIILSSDRTTASADDILPVLVFVIIKANPPALLSNIQFIEGFYAKRMQGSEAYWWTQFNSAVEFLKTLLNKLCN